MIPLATLLAASISEVLSRTDHTPPGPVDEALLDYCDEITSRVAEWLATTHPDKTWKSWLSHTDELVVAEVIGNLLGLSVLDVGNRRIALLPPGDEGVLKIDLSGDETVGNIHEIRFWATVNHDPWWRERLVPVVAWGREGQWLLMPKVEVMGHLPSDQYDRLRRRLYILTNEVLQRDDYSVWDIHRNNVGLWRDQLRVLDYELWRVRPSRGLLENPP